MDPLSYCLVDPQLLSQGYGKKQNRADSWETDVYLLDGTTYIGKLYIIMQLKRWAEWGWGGLGCVCMCVCGWGCWIWKPVHGDGMNIFWTKSQKKSSGASHVLFCNLHVMQHQSVWSLTWGLLEKECAQSSKLFIPDHYCCRRFLWTLKHFLQQKTTLVV